MVIFGSHFSLERLNLEIGHFGARRLVALLLRGDAFLSFFTGRRISQVINYIPIGHFCISASFPHKMLFWMRFAEKLNL